MSLYGFRLNSMGRRADHSRNKRQGKQYRKIEYNMKLKTGNHFCTHDLLNIPDFLLFFRLILGRKLKLFSLAVLRCFFFHEITKRIECSASSRLVRVVINYKKKLPIVQMSKTERKGMDKLMEKLDVKHKN